MPELRKDPIVGRWVVVNVENPTLPEEFHLPPFQWRGDKDCPFCYNNEAMTPPEIEAISEQERAPNTPGWKVRVVPNKFPALRIEGDLDKQGIGLYDFSNGIGAHEVIIENPEHYKGLDQLSLEDVGYVLKAYRSRSLDLRKDRRFKYILIFKNVGVQAGASLEHGHSQLIALPMVPKNVKEEVKGAKKYYEFRERCIFCDIIAYELEAGERIVCENDDFLAFCPLSSRFSFEVWIIPKEHLDDYGTIGDVKLSNLAQILKEVIGRLHKVLGDHPYNYIIHTSPVNTDSHFSYHWHFEIMPKLTRVAGFEWGSGFYVVFTPPELAAKYLREVKLEESNS
ncbi:MAG: galactose-1-phosphate uridylyltransferase [Candidatus Omnitrophota bacterium]|nr:MAG: galactose-1-phosphate uridylyltransferase [Candidatus Omnitrophota bacterium]HDN85723.1 galactose-1-phosphate uridylyltransferase [Candidatus Omnitrophota bacterium]